MEIDLAFVWAGLIAFAVLAYVILDGFDLGIGILFPFIKDKQHRDTAMNSVAPVWDGNETWLVLGGGGLYAAFPLAYAIILPAVYAPLTAMLLGLVLRGVAFEFRWKTERGRFLWDWSFAGGSAIAAFAQGIVLGAFVQGIPVIGRSYGGGWFDWLTPFSVMTGLALMAGYALLGATWLVMKSSGALQRKVFAWAQILALFTLGFIVLVSLWTPFLNPIFMTRWFSWPAIIYVAPVPLLVALCGWRLLAALRKRKDLEPFLASLGLFLLSYIGLGISLYPEIVPPRFTIWDAAAPDTSLLFLLVGAAILIPIILAYTAVAYWVFRGKVETHGGYH